MCSSCLSVIQAGVARSIRGAIDFGSTDSGLPRRPRVRADYLSRDTAPAWRSRVWRPSSSPPVTAAAACRRPPPPVTFAVTFAFVVEAHATADALRQAGSPAGRTRTRRQKGASLQCCKGGSKGQGKGFGEQD